MSVGKFKAGKILGDDGLAKAGFIFMLGSFSAAAFNYLYHVFMARMLGPYDYGILGSLFALIYVVTFATGTLHLVISKFAAEFHSQPGLVKSLLKRSFSKILIFGIIGLVIFFIFIPSLQNFLHLQDVWGLVLVGIIGLTGLMGALGSGALNGLQKFGWQNSSGFLGAGLKLTMALLFVWIGLGVHGALGGVLLGSIAGLFIMSWPLKKYFKGNASIHFDAKQVYQYAWPVFLASLLPVLLITLDQLLVKHYFSSLDAGYYAAAGNIARMIWFGSGFLGAALFPKFVASKAEGKSVSKLLTKGLLTTSFFVFLGCDLLFATPRLIVLVMYGQNYLALIPFLGMFGLALGLFSLNQILIMHSLAVEKYKFLWIILIGFVIEILGILAFHTSLSDIIKILLLSQAFILAGLLVYDRKEISSNG